MFVCKIVVLFHKYRCDFSSPPMQNSIPEITNINRRSRIHPFPDDENVFASLFDTVFYRNIRLPQKWACRNRIMYRACSKFPIGKKNCRTSAKRACGNFFHKIGNLKHKRYVILLWHNRYCGNLILILYQ